MCCIVFYRVVLCCIVNEVEGNIETRGAHIKCILYIFINQVSHVFYVKKGVDMHSMHIYQNSSNGGKQHTFCAGEMTVQDEAGESDMLAKFPQKIYNFSVLFDLFCAKNITVKPEFPSEQHCSIVFIDSPWYKSCRFLPVPIGT